MSEAKHTSKSSTPKSGDLVSTVTTTVMTALFASVAAGCFMSVIFGIRSIHQHGVDAPLRQIDTLLGAHPTGLAPPGWVYSVQSFYHHWQDKAIHHSDPCFSDFNSLSNRLPYFPYFPYFQEASASDLSDSNPLAREFLQTCSALKTQILPLLTGIVAVVVNRLWIFITALPLLALSLGLGLIEGLVQRDIRKFQGARETTLLFHRIKRCGTALFFIPFFLYLAWLSPLSPQWFFIPMAVGLGLWLALTMRFFKKSV